MGTDGGKTGRRLAETIARAIELDVLQQDLPVGAMIGTETDLMERYEASRGVIREAVCLVESHMLGKTRRGLGGGLVVAEPDESVVGDLVSLFLARRKATEVELHEVRIALEMLALRKVMSQLDRHAVEVLRRERAHELGPDEDLAAASQRLHVALAELSENKVLHLFVTILTTLVEEMWTAPRRNLSKKARAEKWERVSEGHAEIIDAILAEDRELAESLLRVHLEDVSKGIAEGARPVRAHEIG